MKFQTIYKKGFTLIELLLVIVIMAALSVYAITMLRDYQRNKLAQNIVLQMQTILQAANMYYVNNENAWPSDLNTLVTEGYIPPLALCSPILTQVANKTCQHRVVYSKDPPPEQTYPVQFGVTLDTIPRALANKVMEGLATYSVTSKTTSAGVYDSLTSYTVAPTFTNVRALIETAGITTDQQTITLPNNCPVGYEGHMILIPQNFTTYDKTDMGNTSGPPEHFAFWSGLSNPNDPSEFEQNVVSSTGELNLDLNANVQSSSTRWNNDTDKMYYEYFMTFCTRNWSAGFAYTAEDAQCSTSWSQYNYGDTSHVCTCQTATTVRICS